MFKILKDNYPFTNVVDIYELLANDKIILCDILITE
jgi:hypothetical protein